MSQETILYITIAVLISFVVGVLIGKSGGSSQSKETQAAQKELEDYKASVSEHFGKTADLIDNLTTSYKDVFEHLGDSAQKLLSEEQVQQHLASRAEKAITLTYLKGTDQNANNPMLQAQEEIQSERVFDKTKEDAHKMAQSMTKTEEVVDDAQDSETSLDSQSSPEKISEKEKNT